MKRPSCKWWRWHRRPASRSSSETRRHKDYDGQFFNVWLGQYALANHIPAVNYHDPLCQCAGLADAYGSMYAIPEQNSPVPVLDPTDAGYTLITEMAQTAIATSGLTIKSGYLSNLLTTSAFIGTPPSSQVNNVVEGEQVTFTPQAKWSDGVVRPMLDEDYSGLKGTWSSNPFVMTVNQQGQAYAYGARWASMFNDGGSRQAHESRLHQIRSNRGC
jgi:hypothetical protein